MGVIVEWAAPESETTYDKVRIYRATSEAGTYSLLATVTDVSVTYYYDRAGTTNMWYKIDFYDTTNSSASALSDAIQGGTAHAYCTPDEVREVCNLSTTDISDTNLWKIIRHAGAQLNSDIQVYHLDEEIQYWAADRENDIDGANTTFWTKEYPLGDANNDMHVDTEDVVVESVDSAGTRAAATVSSIIAATGKYVLSTAPTSDKTWYVTYYSAPVRVDLPHRLVKMATMFLAAAYAFSKINVGKAKSVQMGNVKFLRHMESFDDFYSKYEKILSKINDGMADMIEAVSIA